MTAATEKRSGSILVTGATGNVGGPLVARLVELGARVRAAVREPAGFAPPGVEIVAFDFLDPATFEAALRGVDRIFLVRPPALARPERDMAPFLRAAEEAGVRHVVFLSLLGAEHNRLVPHARIEDMLRHSRMSWTFLRPSFFMQNLAGPHADDIRERDEILVPAGHGETSFIDARDIAAVAAHVLTTPGHAAQAYDLTGAEALTYDQVADTLSEVLHRPIHYRAPGALSFIRHSRCRGEPWPFVLVMTAIYTVARLGNAGRVTDAVERLLHRPPTPLGQFLRDYAEVWARPAHR